MQTITPSDSRPMPSARLLGELLVESGAVSAADVQKALAFQEQFGGRIGSILVRLGALSEESLLPVLAGQLAMPILGADEWPEQPAAIRDLLADSGFSLDWWTDNGVAAWRAGSGVLVAVARDPLDPLANEALGKSLGGVDWQWRLVRSQDLDRLLDMAGRSRAAGDGDLDDDVSHLLAHAMLARPLAGLADPAYWIDYALRRVLRIWPLYLVVLLLSWGLTSLGVVHWHYQLDAAAFWRHLTLREGQSVLWSIPVEFTFYLWLPIVCLALLALRRVPGGRWWGVALLAALLVLARRQWPAAQAPVNGVQLGFYLPVFLAGVAAAWIAQEWPSLRRLARAWRAAGWLLLAVLVLVTPALWAAISGEGYNPELGHRWFTAFGFGWALLLLSVLWGGGVLSRLFASAPMRLVGVVSFSAYLWHMPVLQAADALGLRSHGLPALLVVLAAMLAVAMGSFLLFERPWRDMRFRRH